MLTGDMINAEEALRLGLVSKVVPRDELMKEATDFAEKLAKAPPLTMGYTKQLAYEALENDLIAQIDCEMQLQALCQDTEDSGRKACG